MKPWMQGGIRSEVSVIQKIRRSTCPPDQLSISLVSIRESFSLPAMSTAQLSGKFECGSANEVTNCSQVIIIELAHCPAGAEGGNHVTTCGKDRSGNATNTH